MRKNLTVVCAALLAASFVSAKAQPYTGSVEIDQVEQDWYTEASMTMEEAIWAAEDAVEDVKLAILAASLEIRHKYLVYEISAVDDKNQNHMFTVDAGDLTILAGLPGKTAVEEAPGEETAEPEEPAVEEPAPDAEEEEAKLHPAFDLDTDMPEAIAAAQDEFSGYTLRCKLGQQGETWVYTVLIADKDIETETILIDGGTGEVYNP